MLTFPAALAKDATTPLRAADLRFNKVLQHWEGLARFDDADKLATAHSGSTRRVVSSPLPSPAPTLETAAE